MPLPELKDIETGLAEASREQLSALIGDLERIKAAAWTRLLSPRQHESPAENLLTAPQVAARLAIPQGRVYELSRQGRLPVIRVGKYLRFDPGRLNAWISDHADKGLDKQKAPLVQLRHDGQRTAKGAQALGPDPSGTGPEARRYRHHRSAVGTVGTENQ